MTKTRLDQPVTQHERLLVRQYWNEALRLATEIALLRPADELDNRAVNEAQQIRRQIAGDINHFRFESDPLTKEGRKI